MADNSALVRYSSQENWCPCTYLGSVKNKFYLRVQGVGLVTIFYRIQVDSTHEKTLVFFMFCQVGKAFCECFRIFY